MTCVHVLGLIDMGSLADYPSAHLDAAWQHARQCATCGPALEAATALATDLSALPQPAPPAELARTVLARLARIEAQSTSAASVMEKTRARSRTRDWSPWVTTLSSLAAGLAIAQSMPPGGGALIVHITSPRVGTTVGLAAMHLTGTWALVLAASLGLYVVGLFAPLRRTGRR